MLARIDLKSLFARNLLKGVKMTIKNIGLSIVAVSVLATTGFAGTVTNPGNVGLIGQEKLSLNDVNVTDAFGDISDSSAIKYTPTDIPATSLKNPIFKFTFANVKDLKPLATTAVFEVVDGNENNITADNYKMVAKSPQVSGSNSNIISFNAINANTYAYNNKTYVVADANGTDNNVTGDARVQATVLKGSTSNVTLQAELYSGDSQAQADLAPATVIAKVGPEYVGSVTNKYDARIDASNSFYTFYDQYNNVVTTNTKKQDSAIFNLHQNATLPGASLGVTGATLVLTFDQNLTKNGYSSSAGATADNDMNVTDILGGIFSTANDHNETLTLTVDGQTAIPKTTFDAHAYVTSGTTNFDLITKSTGNAGAWTIYGYNAQIPNVVGNGNIETTMKFTNRSSLDTNIYFTLIDPDGTVAKLNSVDNPTLPSLKAGTTSKYDASTLLGLVTDPAFNKTGSFSVEVSIPTTPNSVYGFASFRNLTLGQFKDLPIYNTSKMTY